MKKLKLYKTSHWLDNDSFVIGCFFTKKEFIEQYEERIGIDKSAMDREDKADYNEQMNDLFERGDDDFEWELAAKNPGRILIVPKKYFSDELWKKRIEGHHLVGGKFVQQDILDKVNDSKILMEKADNYDQLKERLIRLAENLKEDECGAMI